MTMTGIKDKINERMDAVQEMMESNLHLENPEKVLEMIGSVSKFWSALSEEDREYIECARYAIEEKSEWNV